MARSGMERARPPFGLLAVVLFVFAAWTMRVAFVQLDRSLLGEALRGLIFVGPVVVYLLFVERTNPLRSLGLDTLGRGTRRVLLTLGPAFVAWYVFLDFVLGDGGISLSSPWPAVFAVFSLSTLVEEIFFRGFLLNGLQRPLGFWRANAVSAVLFTSVHLPGWFALGRFAAPQTVAVDALGLFVFGLAFGWAMHRTGSLWPAYLLHALNNLLVVSLIGIP